MNKIERTQLDQGSRQKIPVSHEQYCKMQRQIILKLEKSKKLRKKLGHKPTDQEAEQYYLESGGAEKFAEKYRPVQEK